jgi:hypothetical protein
MIRPDRLAEIERRQLAVGAHDGPAKGMCVMEAVSYVAGEPWSDAPSCACPVVGEYLRTLNDRMPHRERQELKSLIPRLVGSRSAPAVARRRAYVAADSALRVFAVTALDAAGRKEDAERLRALPEIVDGSTATTAAHAANAAAAAAARAARAAVAARAASTVADAAAAAAAYAANAACVARAAAAAAAARAARAAVAARAASTVADAAAAAAAYAANAACVARAAAAAAAAYAADAACAARAANTADAWDGAVDLAERMLDITESPDASTGSTENER